MNVSLEEKEILFLYLLRFINVKDIDSCWEWTGSLFENGYAKYTSPKTGQCFRVSRLIYSMCYGNFDPVLNVCHTCDNKKCVNFTHLWLGTQKENQQDMTEKGRGRFGCRNGRAVVTPQIVLFIRKLDMPHRKIAMLFDISKTQVGRIKRGEHWTHV